MRCSLLPHLRVLRAVEVPNMQKATNIGNPALGQRKRQGVVRIRQKIKTYRYLHGKGVYNQKRLELTISAKFHDIVAPFLYTDLKVEATREGNTLILEAMPIERAKKNV
jgi:hypothetical protein